MRTCRNPECGGQFAPVSCVHWFCSDSCRRAVRGSEYRKARAIALYRDEYKCTECDCPDNLHCHRKRPLCQGGDHSLDNLQTLCHDCHKEKHRSWKEIAYEPPQMVAEPGRPGESEVYDYAA